MELVIDTQGYARNTVVKINGEVIPVVGLSFSIKVGGKAKLQMQRIRTHPVKGKWTDTLSYFAGDFEKWGEKYSPELGYVGKEIIEMIKEKEVVKEKKEEKKKENLEEVKK